MCGACGSAATTWTERIAPLTARGARLRARALTALLRAAPERGARRVSVAPWPGGGWRIGEPGGQRFAPSLVAAAEDLTRRHGALVPLDPLDRTTRAVIAPVPDPHALAVWCAAARAAGIPAAGAVTLRAGGATVVLEEHGGVHVAGPPGVPDAVLESPRGAAALAAHLAGLGPARPGDGH